MTTTTIDEAIDALTAAARKQSAREARAAARAARRHLRRQARFERKGNRAVRRHLSKMFGHTPDFDVTWSSCDDWDRTKWAKYNTSHGTVTVAGVAFDLEAKLCVEFNLGSNETTRWVSVIADDGKELTSALAVLAAMFAHHGV